MINLANENNHLVQPLINDMLNYINGNNLLTMSLLTILHLDIIGSPPFNSSKK